MRTRLNNFWQSTSIKNKIGMFSALILLTIFLFAVLEFWILKFSLLDFHQIMEGNSVSSELADALVAETREFESYVKTPSAGKKEVLDQRIRETAQCVDRLPYNYSLGEEIYRLTWNIRNLYDTYKTQRDVLLVRGENMPDYIPKLYEIYDIQAYMLQYVRNLNTANVYAGSARYYRTYPWMIGLPLGFCALILLFVAGMIQLASLMKRSIVDPVEKLAEASGKITENEFYIEDIQVENQDELGELVRAFNKMKDSTGKYIQTLEENRAAKDRIHQQEIEQVEMERRLESAKMQVLKGQMKPHFLFNTLNVISGMADLENADITEKMIKSLSNLLRYTLETELTVVPLEREIRVAQEYAYLQHMRFGARICFELDCRVDQGAYRVPTFLFQPLVENAIIHGLSPKVEGGRVRLKITEKDGILAIRVTDNGVGMSKERLEKLRKGLVGSDSQNTGIAFDNICKRLESVYTDSKIQVYSKKDLGTIVKILIPAKEAACIGY